VAATAAGFLKTTAALRDFNSRYVGSGSTAAVSQCPKRVRLSPNSGAKADMPARRIHAPGTDSCTVQQTALYSITSSAEGEQPVWNLEAERLRGFEMMNLLAGETSLGLLAPEQPAGAVDFAARGYLESPSHLARIFPSVPSMSIWSIQILIKLSSVWSSRRSRIAPHRSS
jgi:hypothetical protein